MSAKCQKCGTVWARADWAAQCDCATRGQASPDETVIQVKREAKAEFRDILWQVVGQRLNDAMEGLARLSQPEVGEKRAMTTEQMVREYMLDIGVAREAAAMLQDIGDKQCPDEA